MVFILHAELQRVGMNIGPADWIGDSKTRVERLLLGTRLA
jgi:hypothetical protein